MESRFEMWTNTWYDRVFTGKSKRDVIKHLAFEEGVEHKHNDVIVKCKDGTIWCVSKI